MYHHILLELCLLYNQLPAQILISLWQTIISLKVKPVSALHILILPLVLQIITVIFFYHFDIFIYWIDTYYWCQSSSQKQNHSQPLHSIWQFPTKTLTLQFAWNKYGWSYIANKMRHAKHYMVIRAHLGRYDKAEG